MADSNKLNFYVTFLVGSISAAISKTAAAPLERVKLLLQLQDASLQIQIEKKYKGIVDCVLRVNREQGFLSFWRGNLPDVIRYFPATAFTFATKDWFKRTFLTFEPNTPKWKTVCGNIAAGGIAGAAGLAFVYPLDYARTRLAVDVGKVRHERIYTGTIDCIKRTFQTDGIVGLYRGLLISISGVMIYRASYFGLYDSIKETLKEKNITLSFMENFAIAQTVVILSGILLYPFDTIRRRMMMQSGRKDILYSGTMDCVLKIYRQEGLTAFFKGGLTKAIGITGGALMLILYDMFKFFLLD